MPAPLPERQPDAPCPTVLACDTSQQACSVALALPDGGIVDRIEETGRGHTEKLPVMMASVLDAAGKTMADLDRLGVTTGPGTFAGVRVGLAAMRAIRLSRGLPIHSLPTTHALALSCAELGRPCIAVMDARRGELYGQVLDASGLPLCAPMALPPESLADEITGHNLSNPVIVGSGAEILGKFYNAEMPDVPCWPQAARMAEWVARQPDLPENAPPPEPLYLRAPDAKLPAADSFLERRES